MYTNLSKISHNLNSHRKEPVFVQQLNQLKTSNPVACLMATNYWMGVAISLCFNNKPCKMTFAAIKHLFVLL
jgi:hypothetical protein